MNDELLCEESLIDIPASLIPEEEILIPSGLTSEESYTEEIIAPTSLEENEEGIEIPSFFALSCAAVCTNAAQQGGICNIACESPNCQTTCQIDCQTTCEKNCQNCQTCQDPCQLGTSCQTGCQKCQDACQLGTSCQTTCEVYCQTTCELNCQTNCQTTSCMTNCELNCEGCQTDCQLNGCQSACELGT